MTETTVLAPALKIWLDRNEAVLIDVREPDEYAAAHIKGAKLVPLGQLTAADIPELKGRKLVMQCKSGGRSGAACAKLAVLDPSLQPLNLVGGILSWIQNGYDIET